MEGIEQQYSTERIAQVKEGIKNILENHLHQLEQEHKALDDMSDVAKRIGMSSERAEAQRLAEERNYSSAKQLVIDGLKILGLK